MTREKLTALLLFYGVIGLLVPRAFSADVPRSKETVALVDKAVALVESKGKPAFPEFKKKGSEWLKGETYIFIADMNGTILMHPANPELETKNIMDMKDANGRAFMRDFVE